MKTDTTSSQLREPAMETSESLQYLATEMVENDMQLYLCGDWERSDWNVCRILSIVNSASKEAWNCYPFD